MLLEAAKMIEAGPRATPEWPPKEEQPPEAEKVFRPSASELVKRARMIDACWRAWHGEPDRSDVRAAYLIANWLESIRLEVCGIWEDVPDDAIASFAERVILSGLGELFPGVRRKVNTIPKDLVIRWVHGKKNRPFKRLHKFLTDCGVKGFPASHRLR
jgi:hypothetical protein